MTSIGHIGLSISMTLFLLLPALALAQSPFRYLPLPTLPAASASNAIDIVVEPETYTPSFYAGRAEPISGSRLKLIAIPHQEISAEALGYRWQVAGKNLDNEPKKESQSVLINVPVGQTLTVKVEVFDQAGKILATKTETISIGDMDLAFYESNALRGLSQIAISADLIMVGEEIKITAIPYFSDLKDIGGNLITRWSVGGQLQTTEQPWELTLVRDQLPKDALIDFLMQNHRTLEKVEASFNLKL